MNIHKYNQAKAYLLVLIDAENGPSLNTLSDIAYFCEFDLRNSTPENLHSDLQSVLIEECRIYIGAAIRHSKTYLEQSLITDDIILLIDAGLNQLDSDRLQYMIGEQDKLIIVQQSKLIYEMTFEQRKEYLQHTNNFGVLLDLADHLQMKVTSAFNNILQQINAMDYVAKHKHNLRKMRESENFRDHVYSRRVELCAHIQRRMFQDFIQAIDEIVMSENPSYILKAELLTMRLEEQYYVTSNAIQSGEPQVYIDFLILCSDYILTKAINLSVKFALELQAMNLKFVADQQLGYGLMFLMRSPGGVYVYNRIFKAVRTIMSASLLFSSCMLKPATSKHKMNLIEQLGAHYTDVMAAFNNTMMQPNILQNPLLVQQLVVARKHFYELMLFYTYSFIKQDLSNDTKKDLVTKINVLYKFIEISDEKTCATILKLLSSQRSYLIPIFSLNELDDEIVNMELKIRKAIDCKVSITADIRQTEVNDTGAIISKQDSKKQALIFSHFTKALGKAMEESEKYTARAFISHKL